MKLTDNTADLDVGNANSDILDYSQEDCMHIQLERSKPITQKGSAHMLACNCPMCSVMC